MTTQQELLIVNPVFVGLTRPPMVLGVTMDYLGLTVILSLSSFILFATPWYLLMLLPMHVIGVIACAIDQHIFSLLLKRLSCQNVANKKYWGCQSYAPY